MVLDATGGSITEAVESQAVLGRLERAQEGRAERRPFGVSEVALEDALLEALAVVLAEPGHLAEASAAFGRGRGDVVADQGEHYAKGIPNSRR